VSDTEAEEDYKRKCLEVKAKYPKELVNDWVRFIKQT
jgi:hypothetical protein